MKLNYVTSSPHKRQEFAFVLDLTLDNTGRSIRENFHVDFQEVSIKETLSIDLHEMVRQEVLEAYDRVLTPCFVEHAGLIFSDHADVGYPGGLTKPMWTALGPSFLEETHSANRQAKARAVVAYCDGMSVTTFAADTEGILADHPRGSSEFYWDTVFIPEGTDKTYAELVDENGLGHKVQKYSQSAKALKRMFEHLGSAPSPPLWERTPFVRK
jgi:XTP/dITP diphosphohydrolase